jgi:predicted NAD/FAD-binding protein
MDQKKKQIAVVGGGVSGIVSAYLLQNGHAVTIFENNKYLGGHTNTRVVANGPAAGTPIDTGFIVHNDRTYPHFTKFITRLGITAVDSDMSFATFDRARNFFWSSYFPNGFFAQRKNIAGAALWRMLADMAAFNSRAKADLARGTVGGISLGDYCARYGYSDLFMHYYLVPMVAAIWSSPEQKTLDFPCDTLFRFCVDHGLLDFTGRPQWKTLAGGNRTYVEKFLKTFSGTVRLQTPVKRIAREDGGVTLTLIGGETLRFDAAVIATHADQALQILADPDEKEKKLLGAWRYSKNQALLHTDSRMLPPVRRGWASWNYLARSDAYGDGPIGLTYWMNRLQPLKTRNDYFVSLNLNAEIDPALVEYRGFYEHPQYDARSLAAQRELPELNGRRNTYYCGSYFGYGFHEDAVHAAAQVAAHFGVSL